MNKNNNNNDNNNGFRVQIMILLTKCEIMAAITWNYISYTGDILNASCDHVKCTMCGSRKYPYPPHGWFFSFYPPPPRNFPSRGSFVDPPPPRNFHFFWRGFFFKLKAFLSLNKSENTSFISTQPLLIICCTHYRNIS